MSSQRPHAETRGLAWVSPDADQSPGLGLVVVSEECIGTPAVAFQPRTLRRVVKQSRWGFNRSAARIQRKPSQKLDEENFTRRLPEARKGKNRGLSHVVRLCD